MDASQSTAPPKAAAPKDDLSGTTLGDFRLERRLGQGGMGQVYLAEQVSLARRVAVKVMRPEMTANPTALKRFKTEAQAIAKITHPNIVQIFVSSEQAGTHYIALEYVEGFSLGQYMARKGPLPVDLTLKVLKQVAAALAHASEQGIVHRDIKPENILITKKAEAKVTDFGLARSIDEGDTQVNLTQSGVIVGTPVYMSPEQVQGMKPDCRTDIYSLGVTAFHMLAGRPPFKGESAFELALQHVQTPPPPLRELRPNMPAELEAIVLRMMAKNREDRFANGKELVRALNTVPIIASEGGERMMTQDVDVQGKTIAENGAQVTEAPRRKTGVKDPTQKLAPKKRRRSIALWIGIGVAALMVPVGLVGAGLAYYFWHGQKTEHTAHVEAPPEQKPTPPPSKKDPPPRKEPPAKRDPLAQLPPDDREEERLRNALPETFTYLNREKLRSEIHAYVELGNYYLRTRQWSKAEKYFLELMKSGKSKPQAVHVVGEIGMGVAMSQRGEVARSNEAFMMVMRRKAPPNGGTPRVMMHNPALKPFVIDALDRNAKAGELPVELAELRRSLDGRPPVPD